jgi:hypothetical protein
MAEATYYVYTDDANDYYYYDVATMTTSYSRPRVGYLLDPATHAPFVFPKKESRHRHHKHKHRLTIDQPDASPVGLDDASPPVADAISAAPIRATITLSGPPRSGRPAPTPARSQSTVLPADLRAEIHQFQITEFAHQFFREHRKGGIFSRKAISVEDLSQWQSGPLKGPLLKSLPAKLAKPAAQCFKFILSYTGAEADSRPGNALTLQRLLDVVFSGEELRDELYFQLVKQTRRNPNADCLYRTWELFLLAASVFPSTRNAESYIKSHIVESADTADARVSNIAQFTFIRFEARCAIGKAATDPVTPAFIKSVITAHERPSAAFSAPLREQLWCQRVRLPRMAVPIIVHEIATALLARGAEGIEGVFRLPGNMRLLREVQASIQTAGAAALAPLQVHDLASLFKSWFGGLPPPIVHRDLVPQLTSAAEDRAFVAFADGLPELGRGALKYLVGFLRHFAAAAAATKMDARNLAIVFAPNIVDVSGAADPMLIARMSETSRDFLVTLITDWDFADVWPVPPDVLNSA